MTLNLIIDVFWDSLTDTARMVPFLFAAYLIIEWVERSKSHTVEKWLARGGRFGFVPGAVLGCLPQCGFSAMAANFYASSVVTIGTLLAVFIATSDEAIPLMLAQPESYKSMLLLVGTKLVLALLVGFVLDILLVKVIPASLRGGYEGKVEEVSCHDHDEQDSLLMATLKHTLSIFLTVLVFTFAFGLLVALLGEENISRFMSSLGIFQPVVAGLFGLIPNCASSVLITQLYLNDTIAFGSTLAGLSTNAGIGLTVLFRANKNLKQNLFILALLFTLGTLFGLVAYLLGV